MSILDKILQILKAEPNLKARDVARKLSCKKNDINPILYANLDRLSVDLNYRWRLKENEAKITFKKKKWINCDSFEQTLKGSIDDLKNTTTIRFILPDGSSFLLDALARLLALCNQLVFIKKNVTIDFCNNENLKNYLNRAGFFDHLDQKVSILPKRPTSSTADSHMGKSENLVELGLVTPNEDQDAKDGLVIRLTNKFVALTNDKYKTAVSTMFAELTGNIQDHSETKLNGFAGLQKYGGINPHIQTIVSDSGVGIAATLRPSLKVHYKSLFEKYHSENVGNDIALVTEVMSKGLISRFGAGRGLGLKTSRDRALKFNARYSVRQESFSLDFIFTNEQLTKIKEKRGLANILGTHICFDFEID